jgi:hypothetical protein
MPIGHATGTDSPNIATVVLAPGQENPIKNFGFQAYRSQEPLEVSWAVSSSPRLREPNIVEGSSSGAFGPWMQSSER